MANDLSAGKGTAGKLLKDDALYNNLNSTLKHANNIMAEADAGKGGLGLMLKDPKFRKDLSDTLSNVNTLVAGINDGRGTLGKLATDDAAYTNLNKLLTESTNLVTTIRSDPKKYLTIHHEDLLVAGKLQTAHPCFLASAAGSARAPVHCILLPASNKNNVWCFPQTGSTVDSIRNN